MSGRGAERFTPGRRPIWSPHTWRAFAWRRWHYAAPLAAIGLIVTGGALWRHIDSPALVVSGPFQNCDAARAAGAAPLSRGSPGYAPHLDRDGDGIACEPWAGSSFEPSESAGAVTVVRGR